MNPKIENSTLKFLKDLAKNNNRDWFTENKEKYVAANENAVNFVEDLIEKVA
ncbi:MAG TPA: TIGR02453 family protein, partial [Chryseobacterium sp.]|nr:TIGR02453 family protein [Chryseobacterium sp.]